MSQILSTEARERRALHLFCSLEWPLLDWGFEEWNEERRRGVERKEDCSD